MDKGGRGHLPSAASALEILRVLYDDVLEVRPHEPGWAERDRCILSKGHGCLALYAMLADKGFFPADELDRFCHFDALLGGHPEVTVPGVDASTGALGHGLSIGVGMALAAKLSGRSHRVFVVMGDGETNEGSIWEAALSASKHRLQNLIAVVDYNKMQSYGRTEEVCGLEPIAKKWRAFNFATREVDGHDVDALRQAFSELPYGAGPSALICHTVKGKGFGAIENDPRWHHKNKLDAETLAKLHDALEVA
jgi:transketolase